MKANLLILSALSISLLSSCAKDDSEHKAAEALDAKIDSAINVHNYEEAITLIDSLNKAYPLQIEIRRGTIAKRAKAMEEWAQIRIPDLDKQIADSKEFIANSQNNFKFVQTSKNIAGYYIANNDNKDFASKACIQARVNSGDDAQDTPWTLAVNAGKDIALNKLTITLNNNQQYAIDITVSDGSMASVAPERVNELGKYIYENPQSSTAKAVASGSKGQTSFSISANECNAIGAAWKLAAQKDSLRNALIERERLERQLQIARDQKANAPVANKEQATQK
jgi:hypothetical protein